MKKNTDKESIQSVLLDVKRVVKVVKGGRKFSFSALVVAGDKKGRVGFGVRKAKDVTDAREKANKASRKDMELRKIPLYEERTIHHDVQAKSGASRILIKRAPPGTGIIAGAKVRALLQLLGVKDAVTKSIGSSNPNTVIIATLNALSKLFSPRSIAERRSKKISHLSVNGNIATNTVQSKKLTEETEKLEETV